MRLVAKRLDMLSPGFGAFGTAGSTATTIIGNAIIDDISSDIAAEALSLAQSNAENKAEKTAVDALRVGTGVSASQLVGTEASLATKLASKAEQTALNTLTTTVNGKAEQTALNTLTTTVNGKAEQLALNNANTSISNNSDSISALQTASFGTTYWITSPDYDLGPHPDNNLAVRWVHLQTSDPIAVLMYVRVLDATLPAAQYVYPYTNPRVQPRHVVTGGGSRARYVRINCPDPDFSLRRVNITTRRLLDGNYWVQLFSQGTVSGSAGVLNPENVLVEEGDAVGGGPLLVLDGVPLRFIELVLPQDDVIERIQITGRLGYTVNSTITNFNDGLYVTFLDASRDVTYTSASGLMFGGGFGWSRGLSATLEFATGNGVEVCFDNSDVTRILSMDRDLPPFFAANRRFFMRALFDPSAVSQIRKGFIETFTPIIDYL
jgi:hypothetical protein